MGSVNFNVSVDWLAQNGSEDFHERRNQILGADCFRKASYSDLVSSAVALQVIYVRS